MPSRSQHELEVQREKRRLEQLAFAAEQILQNDAFKLVLDEMRDSLVQTIERTPHDGTPQSLHTQLELGRGLRTLRCMRNALKGMVAGRLNAERFSEYLIEQKDLHGSEP